MSKYTTELRYICESEAGMTESKGFSDIDTIITTAAPKIFNFNFPIFDETYRLPLEIKILRHYYTREISEETVGLWKLRLQDRLNIIMPYYNKMYESELLEFNPFYDVNLTREHTIEHEGNESVTDNTTRIRTETTDTDTTNRNVGSVENNGTVNESGNESNTDLRWDLYSDTPQGGIEGINGDTDSVANNTYLTNARKISDTGSSTSQRANATHETGSSTITDTGSLDSTVSENDRVTKAGSKELTNTEDYVEHVTGKQGGDSYSRLLKEFRETFLNIDAMVIEDLSTLFFGLWG